MTKQTTARGKAHEPSSPPQQLSLFDPPPPPPALAPPSAVAPPAVPLPSVPSLAPQITFRHPQAQREIRLGEHVVAYHLRRARRRSIGFLIGIEGLTVSAPRWVTLTDIETALREKERWILRKLHEQRERERRRLDARVEWRDGTSLPFLGETLIVVLDPRGGRADGGAVLNTGGDAIPQATVDGVPRLTLHVGLPQHAEATQIRDAVQSWLQRQARRIFEERCQHFAQQLGVKVKRLSLSSASTRWGSATSGGSIRLNWRLVHFALPIIDYVVAHELAHLREMNHSPAFWDVVRSVLPDYEHRRGALRDEVLPVLD